MKYISLQRPIEQWDVSRIDDMSWLFSRKNCNPNIADWDVSGVTNFVSGCFIEIVKEFIVVNVKLNSLLT